MFLLRHLKEEFLQSFQCVKVWGFPPAVVLPLNEMNSYQI